MAEPDLTFGFNGVQILGNLHFLRLGSLSMAWYRWTDAPAVERCYRWQKWSASVVSTPEQADRYDHSWAHADGLELCCELHRFALNFLTE